MQFQDAEVERLFDQQNCLFCEVLFVGYESENHADSETVAERQPCCDVNRDYVFKTKNRIVYSCERDSCTAQTHVSAHDIGVAVEPLALAFGLTIKEFQGLNRPHGFNNGRILHCLGLDHSLAAFAKDAVQP